jgi:phage gp46-like protein
MSGYVFEGQPRIVIGEDGADCPFVNGQPVMDQGLENAVLLSLFGGSDWVGNSLQDKDSQKYNGHFIKASRGAVTVSNLNARRVAAQADLAWLIKEQLVSQVDVYVQNPSGNSVVTVILLYKPDDAPVALQLSQNGVNWNYQAVNPAYMRL